MTRPTLRQIIRACAFAGDITPDELVARGRKHHVLPARAAAMTLGRSFGYSLPRIGRAIGGRDHTTVLHSVRLRQRAGNQRPEHVREIQRIEDLARRVLAGEVAIPRPTPTEPEVTPQELPQLVARAVVAPEAPPVKVRFVSRHGHVTRDGAIICNPW